jgi:large subunit ribosomal protein L31
MKPGIHPKGYRPVVFHDVAIDKRWIMMSTVQTDQTTVWKDGRTYPIYNVETSMYSHPLYTGTQRIIDTEGRVEKFNKKYGVQRASGSHRADTTT